MCSSPFSMFVAFHWSLFTMSTLLLKWRAQNWKPCSSCDLSRAEQRGKITFINLLATLPDVAQDSLGKEVLTNAGSCSLWCPPGPIAPFLQSCFPTGWPSDLTSTCSYFSMSVRPFCHTFLKVQIDQDSLKNSTTMWYISHSSQFYIICKLAEGASCPTSRSLMESLSSIFLSILPWGTALSTDLLLDSVPLVTTPWG